MVTLLEVFAFLVCALALCLIGIWENAKVNGLWMFIRRNRIVSINRGSGNPVKLLGNLPKGFTILGDEVVKGSPLIPNPLERMFGLYFKGFPPTTVDTFFLLHERISRDLTADTPSAEWIKRDPQPVETSFLLFEAPHWFRVTGIEFQGGIRGDVLIECRSKVQFPIIAMYQTEGKFFEVMEGLVNNTVISVYRTLTYQDFIAVGKDPDSDLSKQLLDIINVQLPNASGYRMDTIFVYRFDSSSDAEARLARLEQTERIQANALKIKAEGEAAAAVIRAKGNVADITEAAKALKEALPNASHTTIAKMAGEVAKWDRIGRSKLISIGGGAVVEVGEKKEGKGKRK